MPITINGNGTITGLAVGGLPDGTVDADTLATNAVTTVKVDGTAITDAKIDGMAASKRSGALPAISGASLTGLSGGITHATVWRLTSNLSGNQLPITSTAMETADDPSSGSLGSSGVTVSAGVFSFPVTGIWRVTWYAGVQSDVDTHQNVFTTEVSVDNGSSWDTVMRQRQGIYKMSTGTSYGSATSTCIVDVTSISGSDAVKVRFEYIAGQGTESLIGDSSSNQTTWEFIRLGDT